MPTRERKEQHAARLVEYVTKYKKCFIVGADNVGSKQFGAIRADLRDGAGNKDAHAVIYMGKNTLIRRTLKLMGTPEATALIPLVKQNMGFIFTNGDLPAIRDILNSHQVGAPAKAGQVTEKQIKAPAGPTGQPPDKTAFFQALNIPTKINRGQIEITMDYVVCDPGDKVGASQAALLGMLDIRPFSYGLKILNIVDNGEIFDPAVLDITDDLLMGKFSVGVREVAALSFGADYPTYASVPHSIIRGFQDLCSIAFACEGYTFEMADTVQDMIDNPDKYGGGGGGDAAADEPEEEPEEEAAEVDMSGGDMFGGDDY